MAGSISLSTRGVTDQVYSSIYQAIERYDLRAFLRDAVDKRVISEEERRELGNSKQHTVRKRLINLIIAKGREQKFIDFIGDYARLVQELSFQLIGKGVAGRGGGGDSFERGGQHSQQLSQDGSSDGSTSPMELVSMHERIMLLEVIAASDHLCRMNLMLATTPIPSIALPILKYSLQRHLA